MDKNRDGKVTMSDIAEELEISKNAVSLALRGKSGVSEALRRKIIDTARAMGYQGFIPESENCCIVALVPEYIYRDVYFYSEIFWAVEQETRSLGHTLVTLSVSAQVQEALTLPQLPTELNILGMLTIGVFNRPYLVKLKETGIPLVSVDIAYNDIDIPSVCSSNLSGGYRAVEHLIKNGHSQIGFIGPIHAAQSIYERWCGYQKAMLEYHLTVNPAYSILGDLEHFQLLDSPEVLAPYVNAIRRFPDAWFCAGDRIALSLMNILSGKGIDIPGAVSVIGFDDLDFGKFSMPPLTTMRVDRRAMGQAAVQLLTGEKRFLKGEASGAYTLSLSTRLMERESVKNRTRT